ncbi:MAG: hypothetical protein U1G08_22105 [Verrucomicrobiota bacterium]
MTWAEFNWDWRRQLRSPLVIALLLSLLIHVYIWLMAQLLDAALRNGWLPDWLRPAAQPIAALVSAPKPNPSEKATPPPQEAWQEIPLQFVEVDPATITDEAPPDTQFYSTANTVAANPDPPKVAQPTPKIDGKREKTLKTFDTTQPSPTPPPPAVKEVAAVSEPPPALLPAPAPAQEARPRQEPLVQREEVKPKAPAPGETLLAKADPKAVTPEIQKPLEALKPQTLQEPQASREPTKPRRMKTLAEARASKGAVVGERMKQEGGVTRQALQSSLNVKASPLGDYNYRMVLAVQDQWYRLLEERKFALERQGQVVITFDLHSDGTVTSVNTKDSNVGDVLSFLCELSVMQPAPFGRWPPEVRRLIGGDTVPVTFTFNYY